MGFLDRLLGRRKATPEDSAPGWEAINLALRDSYGDQTPQHWGTMIKWMLGGPDPLDGTSAYRNEGPPPHWHFVSFGMTDLYSKKSDNPEVSGWGFEFTFRLPRADGEEAPPLWPLDFLQNLARYVFESGNAFAHGHYIDCNGPIALDVETKLTAVLFHRDPQLPPIDTPNGRMEFLQIVGVTHDELDACRLWNTTAFLDVMRERNPLLITDLSRDSILDDSRVAEKVAQGQQRDGSNSTGSYMETLSWAWNDARPIVRVRAKGAETIVLYLRGRTLHGGEFSLFGPEQCVVMLPGDDDHVAQSEDTLTLRLSAATARSLADRIRPECAIYDVMPNVQIEVLPG